MPKPRGGCRHVGVTLLDQRYPHVGQAWVLVASISFMVMSEGAPYVIARLIERRFVLTIHFGNLGGALFGTLVSFNQPT